MGRNVWVNIPKPTEKAMLKAYALMLPVLKRRMLRLRKTIDKMEGVILSGREPDRVLCLMEDDGTLRRLDTGAIVERLGLQLEIFSGEDDEQGEE